MNIWKIKNYIQLLGGSYLVLSKFALRSLGLFFKYRSLGIPFRQCMIFDTAMKVKSELERANIEFVICNGSLLGAVRQGAFAGRPGDFDLAVKEPDIDKVCLLEPRFRKVGLNFFDHRIHSPTNLARFGSFSIMPIFCGKIWMERFQVHILVFHSVDNVWCWKRWSKDQSDLTRVERKLQIEFPCATLETTATIFGQEFPIPNNYQEYLSLAYGAEWKTPSAKQYSRRIPNVKSKSRF